eukprot:g3019.t1
MKRKPRKVKQSPRKKAKKSTKKSKPKKRTPSKEKTKMHNEEESEENCESIHSSFFESEDKSEENCESINSSFFESKDKSEENCESINSSFFESENASAEDYESSDDESEEDDESSDDESEEDDVDGKRITKGRAKSEFSLNDKDLAKLSSPIICKNPHYASAAPMQLYLLSEVTEASIAKEDLKKVRVKEKQAKLKEKVQERKDKLKSKSMLPSRKMDRNVKDFIYGDFCHQKAKPQVGIRQVTRGFKAWKILEKLPSIFHSRIDILELIINNKLKRQLGKRLLMRAEERCHLMKKCFGIELIASRIYSFLSSDDETSALADAYKVLCPSLFDVLRESYKTNLERVERDVKITVAMIRGAEFNVKQFRNDKIIRRMKAFPFNRLVGVKAVREQIRKGSESQEQRRTELTTHLRSTYGLGIRNDSSFCKDYIEFETLCSLEEVAATVALSSYLFEFGGHIAWSNCAQSLESEMRQLVVSETCDSWESAFCEVVNNEKNAKLIRKRMYRNYRW